MKKILTSDLSYEFYNPKIWKTAHDFQIIKSENNLKLVLISRYQKFKIYLLRLSRM